MYFYYTSSKHDIMLVSVLFTYLLCLLHCFIGLLTCKCIICICKVQCELFHASLTLLFIPEVYPVDSDEELSHPPVSQTYRSSKKSVIQKHSNAARPQTDTSTSSATPNQWWHTMRYDEGWRKTRYMYMYINVWS